MCHDSLWDRICALKLRSRRAVCFSGANPTSAEMRLFPLFLRQTPVGDCTSSEEVPDAWSLSPSDPIFRFSWTISGLEGRRKRGWAAELDRWGRTWAKGTGLGTGRWLQQERKTIWDALTSHSTTLMPPPLNAAVHTTVQQVSYVWLI